MPTKSERQAARDAVAAYHEARLAELVDHVREAVDRLRAGDVDAFAVDEVIFQYSRAAKELWKFCNLGEAALVAGLISESGDVNWWEKGERRRRSR